MSRRVVLTSLVVAAAALAAAGCGSSSSSSKTSTAAKAATTPPTPQTPSTGTGTTAAPVGAMPSNIPNSTPIGDPRVRSFLIAELAKQKSIPAKDDAPIVDCTIKKLEGQGYKTVGDAGSHLDKVKADAAQCAVNVATGKS